jgi:hypothetical protein
LFGTECHGKTPTAGSDEQLLRHLKVGRRVEIGMAFEDPAVRKSGIVTAREMNFPGQ